MSVSLDLAVSAALSAVPTAETSIEELLEEAYRSIPENSITICDQILARDANNIDALFIKANKLERLWRFEDSLACFDMVIDLAPASSSDENKIFHRMESLYSKAFILFEELKQKEQASENLELLRFATDRHQDKNIGVKYRIKGLFLKMHILMSYKTPQGYAGASQCIDALLNTIERNPHIEEIKQHRVTALNYKAVVLKETHEYESALRFTAQALQENPGYCYAWICRINILKTLGMNIEIARAQAIFDRFFELPDDELRRETTAYLDACQPLRRVMYVNVNPMVFLSTGNDYADIPENLASIPC